MSTPVQGILNLQDAGIDGNTVASGTLDFYTQSVVGYMMPRVSGPNNQRTSLQSSMAFNRVIWIGPGSGSAVSSIGSTPLTSGTLTNPAPTGASLQLSVRSTLFSTTGTAGTIASLRSPVVDCWRGNAAGLGGFFFVATFGLNTLVAGNRAFVGLSDSSLVATNVDPTTSVTIGKVGLAINTNSGNWNLVNNIAGTAPTVLGLGANFPVNNSTLLQLILYSAPNGSNIQYQVTNLSTGSVATGTLSTNIPASATFLAIQGWITNNATASAAILQVARIYLETDI